MDTAMRGAVGRSSPVALVTLVLANLMPLGGVLALGWNAGQVILAYWLENLVIGAFNVLRIVFCSGDRSGTAHFAKVGAIPFFVIHYGAFCLIHGVIVLVLLRMGPDGVVDFEPMRVDTTVFGPFGFLVGLGETILRSLPPGAWWTVAALAASHAVSFVADYLVGGEFRSATVKELMGAPYARVVVLHVALVFGGFLVTQAGSPVPLLVLLVVGKLILDFSLHLRGGRKGGARATAVPASRER
jgi:hypothetical protein